MTTLPCRTDAHRTDTLAMKKVSLVLGADLLLRSVDERDYGVDALVERFESASAGQFLLFQVKGTTDDINNAKPDISLGGFPRRTALYAEEFVHPFIVAYTSVKNGPADQSPVYYLWLQRYIEYFLEAQDPQWRTDAQTTMTLYMPSTNVVSEDLERIKKIAASSMLDRQAHRVTRATARLQALSSMQPDQLYLSELVWIISAIERSPMITTQFDPPSAALRDVLAHVKKAKDAALTEFAENNLPFSQEAGRELISAVGILTRRMSGMLSDVLVMDARPSPKSW